MILAAVPSFIIFYYYGKINVSSEIPISLTCVTLRWWKVQKENDRTITGSSNWKRQKRPLFYDLFRMFFYCKNAFISHKKIIYKVWLSLQLHSNTNRIWCLVFYAIQAVKSARTREVLITIVWMTCFDTLSVDHMNQQVNHILNIFQLS